MKEKKPERETARSEDKNIKVREQEPEQPVTATTVAEEAVVTKAPSAPPPDSKERRFRQTDLPAHFIERRKHPRISTEQPPPPAPPRLEDYAPIIGKPELDEIRFLARHLRGKTVKMVNSTAVGGGVAEILNRLIPLMNELEVPTRWDVITGGNDFYEVTKGFHNALHGGDYNLTQQIKDIFMAYNEQNRQRMEFAEDLFVIHDPQPAGLIRSRSQSRGRWIWRCHIDLSNPHPGVWEFLKPMIEQYDATIFSAPAFTRQLAVPQYLFYPSIDPLSEKNRDLPEEYINKVCDDFGIDRSRPVITQISRFDRLKDPVGVIEAYKLVKKYVDDVIILNLPPWSALEINALQRASTVIVQKSLKEGFGLTVTEGLWKEKPVVAGAVGGIPTQVIHKLTGVLVHSVEGCAYQIRYLLTHPEFAAQMGRNGREHAKENFLITVNLKRWLLLFQILLGMAKPNTTI